MAGYNDPESGYINGAPGLFTHLGHITDITNKFDKDDVPATGHVWIYDITSGVYRSRALLSTDNPGIVTNTQSTSAYTLVLTDAGKLVETNSASPNNLIVPPNSSVPIPVGSVIPLRQYGAGLTTIVQGASVTVRSRGGLLNMAGQQAEANLTKRATDEWILSGDLA